MRDAQLLLQKLNDFDAEARRAGIDLERGRLTRGETEEMMGAEFDSLVVECTRFSDTYSRSRVLRHTLSEFHGIVAGSVILDAPFVRHCYEKPLGYPGDHQAIEMIYRNSPLVNGVAGLIEKSFLSLHASQAVRNRKELLLRIIR